MRHYRYSIWIIMSLLAHHATFTETPGKTRKIETDALMLQYEQQDLAITQDYLSTREGSITKKARKRSTLQSLQDSPPLSLLSDLAASRPEQATCFYPSMVKEDDVLDLLEQTVALAKDELMRNDRWIKGKTPYSDHFFNTSNHATFKPFMQKKIVPTGSTIFAWGDTHGCIHSLLRTLTYLRNEGYIDDNFTIIKPNTYLIYLGDCVDRGYYGLEVLYTLMRLKTANPDNVMLIRGNHEDEYINKNANSVRFNDELDYKQFHHKGRLYRLYDMFAPVLYLGSGSQDDRSFVMCCHGGLEIGLNAMPLVTAPDEITFMAIHGLNRAETISELPKHLQEPVSYIVPEYGRYNFALKSPTSHFFGYMWSDFLIEDPQEIVRYSSHRGWKYGKELTRYLLDRDGGPEHRVKSVLRAHQHAGLMQQEIASHKGYFSLWDGMVFTILSAPAIQLMPPCPYDSFIQIITAEQWENWIFTHLSNPMP